MAKLVAETPPVGQPVFAVRGKQTLDSVDLEALAIHDAHMTKPSIFPIDLDCTASGHWPAAKKR
jgi:hypothetical protein